MTASFHELLQSPFLMILSYRIHDLYVPNIIRMIKSRTKRWAGRMVRIMEITCSFLGGKPEGNGLFVRPRHSWENNIKMDVMEMG
jgi:hypothetical protein